MDKLFCWILLLLFVFNYSFGQANKNHVRVDGYFRKNGTYVAPHMRTAPNQTINDNFTTKPNVNPYTGEPGTIAPEGTGSTQNLVLPKSNYEPVEFKDLSASFNQGSFHTYLSLVDGLNLRSGPSTKFKVITVIDGFTPIEIIYIKGQWAYVEIIKFGYRAETFRGFVSRKYLRKF